jgi:hypothetical protein
MSLHEKINNKQIILNACQCMIVSTPFERNNKIFLSSLDKNIFNCFSSLFRRTKISNGKYVNLNNEFTYRNFIEQVLICSQLKINKKLGSLSSEINLYCN